MKKLTVLFLSFGLLTLVTSCRKLTGTGPTVTEARTVTGFNAVSSSVSADVYYKQAPTYKVEIVGQQNIIDDIETKLDGNELVIKYKNLIRIRNHQNLIINVSSPNITALHISGSGNLTVSDSINTTGLDLSVSGSGDINIQKLVCSTFDSRISGSGNIGINNGSLNLATMRISGSGDMDAANIPVTTATTTTSGSGDIKLGTLQNLDVTISGSGSVTYLGNPLINMHISGSGKVRRR